MQRLARCAEGANRPLCIAPAPSLRLTPSPSALAQLTNGEGWDTVMFATVDSVNSLWPVLYFLSFSLCVMILFSNIFVGVIIDAFHQLQHSGSHRNDTGQGSAFAGEARSRFEEVLVALCHKAMSTKLTEHQRANSFGSARSADGSERERGDSDALVMGSHARTATTVPAAALRAVAPAERAVPSPAPAPMPAPAAPSTSLQVPNHALVANVNTTTEI
jgi:hypothetical protein